MGLTAHDGTLWVLDYCADCGRVATLVREIDAATGNEVLRCASPLLLHSLDVDPITGALTSYTSDGLPACGPWGGVVRLP